MNNKVPFGSWKSPITADLIVSGAVGLSQPTIDGPDIYWLELRPSEGGRQVIVKRDDRGHLSDINPQPFNARTRVHEYGGGDYLVTNGKVYFPNFADQRLYKQVAGEAPQPLTPVANMRYAEAIMDSERDRIICVREDHTEPGREAVNTLVALNANLNDDCGQVLVSGNDFYSTPRLSPDGTQLVWLTWNHPNMPWNGTQLWRAQIEVDGSLSAATLIAGGKDESIFQPQWSPDGLLYFISDRSGWWNLYRVFAGRVAAVTNLTVEMGVPQWVFGLSCYAFASPQEIVCVYYVRGMARLAIVNTGTLKVDQVDVPYTDLGFVRAAAGQAVFRAGSPTTAPAIVRFDLRSRKFQTLRSSNNLNLDPGYL